MIVYQIMIHVLLQFFLLFCDLLLVHLDSVSNLISDYIIRLSSTNQNVIMNSLHHVYFYVHLL